MGKAVDIEEGPGLSQKGPAKLTVYPATIVPNHYDNDTGIFFPDKYVPSDTVDLLVYFHGLPTPCGGNAKDKIWNFWQNKSFLLREMVNKGEKNVVLVAPRLYGDGGLRLGMDENDFLNKVVDVIAARVKTAPFNFQGSTKMSIGKLILAAHSGGGTPMLFMAQAVAKVRECWGFDSMYAYHSEWVDWAAKGGKYFLFWTSEGGTNGDHYKNRITKIKAILATANAPADKKGNKPADAARADLAAKNIVIVWADDPDKTDMGFPTTPGRKAKGQTKSHCQVPQTYWPEMMNSF